MSTVDDKWIGLALAVSASMAIGISAIITKMGLNAAANAQDGVAASDNHAYLRNSVWWAGISTQFLGEVANFTAYAFAPPILVAPLGGLSILVGAVAASFMLGDVLGHLGRVGCTLSLLGSVIIVLNAPEDKEVDTVDQMLDYAAEPAFLVYLAVVLVFSVVTIYAIVPRYGKTQPWVYLSICSLVGSVSVMAIKAFSIAIKLTIGGNNQFLHPSTYILGLVLALTLIITLNYYNKSLDTFSVNIVNPMYYVGFTSATIVASLILFQGFNTDNATGAASLLCGFAVTFLGVHILDLSRRANDTSETIALSAVPGERGLLNPRQSLDERASIDAWEGRNASQSRLPRHGRTTSTTSILSESELLQGGYSPRDHEQVGLYELREEDEWEDDADERTRLTSEPMQTRSDGSPPRPSNART